MTEPSGSVRLVGPTVRLICCWAKAAPPASRRTEAASPDRVRRDLELLERIAVFLALVRFVNHELTRIDEHHHQHAAGEYVVGGDLALVMRVPHEGEPGLARRGVGDRARGWRRSGRTRGSNRRVRAQIGAAAVPRAVREQVRIGQRYRAAARDIAERLGLQRLVVVLAPLEIVDRSGRTGVVTVGVRSTGELGAGVERGGGWAGPDPALRPPRPN